MARRWEESRAGNVFHRQLLEVMANSAELAGVNRNVKPRIDRIAKESPANAVADARFALGADDGAYLRQNVMPLQTSELACDELQLSTKLMPELEFAGRQGLLQALATELEHKIEAGAEDVDTAIHLAGYLLSIPEVSNFAKTYLDDLDGSQTATEALLSAQQLVAGFSTGLNATEQTRELLKPTNRDAACELLRILASLFGKPQEAVLAQLQVVIGADDTGVGAIRRSLDRLVLAARLVPETLAADAFEFPTVELRLQQAAAVGVNMFATNRFDLTAVQFPPGYDASDEFDDPNSLSETALRRQRRRQRRVEIGANVLASSPPDDLRKVADEQAANAIELAQRLANARNIVSQTGDKTGPDVRRVASLELQTEVYARNQSRIENWLQIKKAFVDPILVSSKEIWILLRGAVPAGPERQAAIEALNVEEKEFNDHANAENVDDVNRLGQILALVEKRDVPGTKAEINKIISISTKKTISWWVQGGASDGALKLTFREYMKKFDKYVEELLGKQQEALEAIANNDRLKANDAAAESGKLEEMEAEQQRRKEALDQLDKDQKEREKELNAQGKRIDEVEAARLKKAKEKAEGRANESAVRSKQAAEARAKAKERRNDNGQSFCSLVQDLGAEDRPLVVDALCAAVDQLREDGGASASADLTIVRMTGITPFFTEPHVRLLNRHADQGGDFWESAIWPDLTAEPTAMSELATAISNKESQVRFQSQRPTQGFDKFVTYALARGLCGMRAVHHAGDDGDPLLKYNLPRADFPLRAPSELDPIKRSGDDEVQERRLQRTMYGITDLQTVDDFVDPPTNLNEEQQAQIALWAPVARKTVAGGRAVVAASQTPQNIAVATVSVLEALVDHYKRQSDPSTEKTLLAQACSAYTKILQLPSVGKVFETNNLDGLCNPHPTYQIDNQNHAYTFETRPVVTCKGPKSKVVYPCDPGLAAFARRVNPVAETRDETPALAYSEAYGECEGTGLCDTRTLVDRKTITPYLRGALLPPSERGEANAADAVPLYVAAPPGATSNSSPLVREAPEAVELRGDYKPDYLPMGAPQQQAARASNLKLVLERGLRMCANMDRYKHELKAIEQSKKELPPVPEPEDVARERRQAVWNDSMREACISGDRLYAFVRQFSGTISEPVDAVCMIDEGMLVRQQQQRRESRERLADRAAQEHMQLVRNVFGAVIRESGLTLGIEKEGDIGQLKVVSNTLRKQATELASGGSSSEGYFANSVRLENLLTKGTGEMTLTDLFGRLKEAGRALQEAAFAAQPVDGVPGAGASLDFLSAPRNSLVLRYKPEALAAIRSAFDLFQREMLVRHGRMYRTITAYELIEGNDEALCTAFASFAAHNLVHSRMYSSATAMYVAAWPAAANAQQMKISLHRLTHLACDYLNATSSPAFLSTEGRTNYFSMARSRHSGSVVPLMFGRFVDQPNGLWGLNMYGNR